MNIENLMNEKTLTKLAIPSGWTIITNNILELDLMDFSEEIREKIVSVYFDYEVFYAKYSHSSRMMHHDLYIYIHCSAIDYSDYSKGFDYDLSYFVVKKKNGEKVFGQSFDYTDVNILIESLNKIFFDVYYNIEWILNHKKLKLYE